MNKTEPTTRKFLIFVSAKTLNPDGATYLDTADPRTLHEMGIVDSDIPGYPVPQQELKLMDAIRALRNEVDRIQAELTYRSSLPEATNKETPTSNPPHQARRENQVEEN